MTDPSSLLTLPKRLVDTIFRVAKTLNEVVARLQRIERDIGTLRSDLDMVRRRAGVVLTPRCAIALLTNGYQIYVDPQDHGGAVNLLTNGCIEEAEIKILRRILKPGFLMLDVGANYGYYSMVAAPYLRSSGRVIGFEPNPALFRFYSESIHLNGFGGIIEARPFGVSSENGTTKFEVETGYPGGGRIPKPDDMPREGHILIDVGTVRLDDQLPRDAVVDIVKIDVEGHEREVLEGMRDIIARSPSIVILMEFFYSFFRDDAAAKGMMTFISENLGLKAQRIIGGGVLVPAGIDTLRGAECTLVLSRHGLPPMPALLFHASQLVCGDGARRADGGGAIFWERTHELQVGTPIVAFGPYLHLPRGSYRVEIDADLEGDFTCRFQNNFGDMLMESQVQDDAPLRLFLNSDARSLEVVLECRSGGPARIKLRSVAFWED